MNRFDFFFSLPFFFAGDKWVLVFGMLADLLDLKLMEANTADDSGVLRVTREGPRSEREIW